MDPQDRRKHVVLPGKRHIVSIGNVVDEELYDQVDEAPPFSTGIEPLPIEDNDDEAMYLRSEEIEGTWVSDEDPEDTATKRKSKKKSKKKTKKKSN